MEHLRSQAAAPELICDYQNLVYACCRCNSAKTDAASILDPCEEGFGNHLEVSNEGHIVGLSHEGDELIWACKLDEPLLTESRRRLLELMDALQKSAHPNAGKLRAHYLGYPSNPPQLSLLRPPGGNALIDGIAGSCFERVRRGELPETY